MDNLNSNVPVLRFQEFDEIWEVKKLGDIGTLISGLTYSPNDINENGILVLRSSNIKNRQLVFDDNVYVNIQKYNPVKQDDILICVRNGSKRLIGKNTIITKSEEGLAFGAFMTIFRSDLNLFIYQVLDSTIWKKNVHRNLGATINSINGGDLKKFKIPFPSLQEQQKIANFLTSIDKRLEQLRERHSLLQDYKKGSLQQIFSQQIRFKNDDGEDFEEWRERRLGEVAERVKRKNKENNSNVLTVSAQYGLISQTKFFNKSVASKDVTGYYLLHRDDYAYNKSYSRGYPMGAFKRLKLYDKGVLSTLYICFKIIDGVLEFYDQFFESGSLNKELSKIAQEGARNHGLLNMSIVDFFNIKMKIPSLAEQQKIANYLTSIDKKLSTVGEQIEQLEAYKRGLLQQMFV